MEEPRARRWCLAFLLLALLLAGLFLWSLNAGSLPLTPGEVWDILVRREGEYAAVIWKLRLPRTLAAALLAASAGLAVVLSSAALGAYAGPAHQTAPASEETPEALSWPLETDGSVTLSALYGSRVHPVTGKTTSHSGIDIPRDAGTPVLAAADGTVEEAGFDAEDGRYVVLRHGSLTTKYCHLQEVDAAGGEQVQTGDAIGRVGSTGQSTGPHLHFEVALDGAAQDPLSYLEHTGTDVL